MPQRLSAAKPQPKSVSAARGQHSALSRQLMEATTLLHTTQMLRRNLKYAGSSVKPINPFADFRNRISLLVRRS
jgi:hypothetical protein